MWIRVLKWNAINKWMTLIFAKKMIFSRLIRAYIIQKVKAGRPEINSRSFWNTYCFKNSISMKPCLQKKKKRFYSFLCKSAKQFWVRFIIKLTVRTERIKMIEWDMFLDLFFICVHICWWGCKTYSIPCNMKNPKVIEFWVNVGLLISLETTQ